jgi:ribose transport system substrate-binding protein
MKLKFSDSIKVFTIIGLIINMISCGGDTKNDSSDGSQSNTPKIKLAFMTNATADFWSYGKAGAEKAASEHDDIEIEFKMGDGTAAKQREICDSLLVRGFKGIAISPPNPKGQQEMLNTWAKKASIITVDSDAPNSDRLFYLGTNNVEAGRQAGELLKEALPDGGKVMVFVGVGDQANAVERYQGLKEAVEGTKIEILDLRTDEANIGKARRNAEDTLTKYPDLAGMVGLWAYNAPACLKAVRDKGVIGKVKIIAFDEEVETLKAIDAGEIHGTVVQQPYEFGYQSIKALRSIIIEEKSATDLGIPDSRQKFIATKMIRKGGGEAYLKQCQEWKSGSAASN